MSKETRLFKSEEPKTRNEAATFLRLLADKLTTGQVNLTAGQQELSVQIPENLILEIQVEKEEKSSGLQHSLEVELKWREGDQAGGPVTLG